MHEARIGIAAAIGGRVGVDAVKGARQVQPVLQRFIAAQARAHHQHGVAGLIEGFDRRLQVEGAQRPRVVLGQHATALRAGDYAEAHVAKALYGGHRAPRTAPQPQHRPARQGQVVGQAVQRVGVGRHGRHRQRMQILRRGDQRRLDINGNLYADGAARRAHGHLHGVADDA
ncbi:hypothetical protein D3C71_1230090 [compost metagenome]